MKAFRDPVTGMLKCFGFVQTNEPGDISMDVPDDFNLEPRKWRWNGSTWVSYTEPLNQAALDRNAARADSAIVALQNMTPGQARTWVQNNVNSLADAKSLLSTMAAILCVLSRRL